MTLLRTLFAATALAALSPLQAAESNAERYRGFIAAAGNSESDAVRLDHLKKLAFQCKEDGVTLAGLDNLIAFIAVGLARQPAGFLRSRNPQHVDLQFRAG